MSNEHETQENFPGQCRLDVSTATGRVASFSGFQNIEVNPSVLGYAGFYFTGIGVQTKCFRCGMLRAGWRKGDDPRNAIFHSFSCPTLQQTEVSNITTASRADFREWVEFPDQLSVRKVHQEDNVTQEPRTDILGRGLHAFGGISRDASFGYIVSPNYCMFLMRSSLHYEMVRRNTFTTITCSWDPKQVLTLAWVNGFFYLGNMDRTQCFNCAGILRNWRKDDDVAHVHKRHFPYCRLAAGKLNENMPIVEDTPDSVTKFENTMRNKQRPLIEKYGTNTKWPHYFPYRSPLYEAESSQSDLTIGQSRDVRNECWYCNGGYDNWEPTDQPWVEPSRCCSRCEYQITFLWHTQIKIMSKRYDEDKVKSFTLNHMTYYDLPSMAFAMKIGLCNVRLNEAHLCVELHPELESNCRIAPPEGQPDLALGRCRIREEANGNRSRKRRSFSDYPSGENIKRMSLLTSSRSTNAPFMQANPGSDHHWHHEEHATDLRSDEEQLDGLDENSSLFPTMVTVTRLSPQTQLSPLQRALSMSNIEQLGLLSDDESEDDIRG